MTKEQQIQTAIKAYKAIVAGKVEGAKIHRAKSIKIGSVTFIID